MTTDAAKEQRERVKAVNNDDTDEKLMAQMTAELQLNGGTAVAAVSVV